jgi:hypothetical protein
MAQKVNIVLVDDIDQSEADETVSFALDGKDYVIDLNKKHASALRDALAPYVGHARASAGRKANGRKAPARSASDAGDIREWAKANGHDVSERGRIASEVREAYAAAH